MCHDTMIRDRIVTGINNDTLWKKLLAELKLNLKQAEDMSSGLSMNILCAGDKAPVQLSFFTNSTGNLLPTLEFLGGLYNFCNLVIMFSLM